MCETDLEDWKTRKLLDTLRPLCALPRDQDVILWLSSPCTYAPQLVTRRPRYSDIT